MRAAERGLLLLTCRLGQDVQPLRPAEYARLSKAMLHLTPAETGDLEVTEPLLRGFGFAPEFCGRILALLDREEALDRYLAAEPDIAAVTRLSEGFPARLRALRGSCPPVLFCRGDLSLFSARCISLVGSRAILPRGEAFATRIGLLAAQEGFVLVSGGAVGADRAAQEACLAAGGRVISFVPDALWKHPARKNLLLCSDEGYELPFSPLRALRRNGFIHALGEKVFVAQCPQCRGGTWEGATDNLRRGLSEVYVLKDDTDGVNALLARGATPIGDFPACLAALTPTQITFGF